MGATENEVTEILESARRMLEFARRGERDFLDARDRRPDGLHVAVTCGRSVTFVLQTLTRHAEGFDDWYQGVQDRLKADPVARWFVELRNRMEKEGTTGPSVTEVHIQALNVDELHNLIPLEATGTFIGDRFGRSGWTQILPDGTEETTYVTLPPSVGNTMLQLDDAPDGRPLEELLPEWLDALEVIVDEATHRFAPGSED